MKYYIQYTCFSNPSILSEAKSKVTDYGIKSTLQRVKVDSGVGLPIVNVLESILEWTYVEIIINSGMGSHTPCIFVCIWPQTTAGCPLTQPEVWRKRPFTRIVTNSITFLLLRLFLLSPWISPSSKNDDILNYLLLVPTDVCFWVSCLGLWKDDLSPVLLAEEVEEVLVEAGVLRVVGRHLYNKIK